MRRGLVGATLVVPLLVGACDRAEDVIGDVRDDLDGAVRAVSEALADAGASIEDATRPMLDDIGAELEDIEAEVRAAADLTGERARDAYEALAARAAELREDAGRAGDEAEAEAQRAWQRVQEALADLEARIRDAVGEL